MKNNTNSKILGYAMLMAAFLIVGAGMSLAPRTASAQWDSYGGDYSSGYYDSGSSYDPGYYDSGSSYDSGFGISAGVSYDPGYYDYGYSSGCSYGCGGYSYPSTYYGSTPTYYPPTQPTAQPLYVSCYPTPLTGNTGDSITWVTDVSGGNGTYSYIWSGTDGLQGGGSSIAKTYYQPGNKSASVTVRSGNQNITQSCSGSATIYQTNNPVYYPPTYPTYPTYQPLTVSCSANTTYTYIGTSVVWSASVYGGNGSYSYSWTGTDGIYGSGQSVYYSYTAPGSKYASVTVYSNGQTITQGCSNTVTVNQNYVQPTYVTPTYVAPTTYVTSPTIVRTGIAGLDIGCYSDPASAGVNQPVTWSAEATGGIAPYRFSWTGTDGLTGNTSSVTKVYDTYGQKSAIVTITSADGKSATHACTNALTIKNPNATTIVKVPVPTAPNGQNANGSALSAASLFSLSGIPWGWVAILVILVLFAMVMYLIFNRPKI